jgi:hypothetical protein
VISEALLKQNQDDCFQISADTDIHRELSQLCHDLAEHPLLMQLARGCFAPAEVAWIYRRRKTIVDSFLPMLSLAQQMAEAAGRVELVRALQINIADEMGLNPDTGQETGEGAHAEWGKRLSSALDLLDPPALKSCHLSRLPAESWDPYPIDPQDSLAVIVGMIMASEKCIPIEYQAFLKGFRIAFPSFADPSNEDCLRQLTDHIDHDERQHLPDLIDGYLGHSPGTRGEVLAQDALQRSEATDLARGMERILSLRYNFYDSLQHLFDQLSPVTQG